MNKLSRLLMLMAVIALPNAYAESSALDSFLEHAQTIKADFSQTVVSGKKTHTTHGSLEISRPNKFRWDYSEDQQLLVSDGKKIYIYDKPLQQVTVKQLGKSLAKSPAALLAASGDLYQLYQVTTLPASTDGLTWVKIEPKTSQENNGFKQVLIGFNQQRLAQMRFSDDFGNQTSLSFSKVQLGAPLPATDFKFTIPAGVDVAEQ